MATDTSTTGRESDKFMLRLPDGMRESIRRSAETHRRTMNGEVIHRLSQSFQPAAPEAGLPEDAKAVVQKEMAARGGTFHEALMRLLTAGEQRSGMVLNLSIQKGMSVRDLNNMLQELVQALPAETEVIVRTPSE